MQKSELTVNRKKWNNNRTNKKWNNNIAFKGQIVLQQCCAQLPFPLQGQIQKLQKGMAETLAHLPAI